MFHSSFGTSGDKRVRDRKKRTNRPGINQSGTPPTWYPGKLACRTHTLSIGLHYARCATERGPVWRDDTERPQRLTVVPDQGTAFLVLGLSFRQPRVACYVDNTFPLSLSFFCYRCFCLLFYWMPLQLYSVGERLPGLPKAAIRIEKRNEFVIK